MWALVSVLAGAIVTGILGNYLVQRWQLRSWYDQQRQLAHQQELADLKKLIDDLSTRADARVHAMRMLARALLEPAPETMQERLTAYRAELAAWNTSLNSFFTRLTLHFGYGVTLDLEKSIHARFVAIGQEIEAQVRARSSGHAIDHARIGAIMGQLDAQHGRLGTFYRGLVEGLQVRREQIMFGKRYHYTQTDLSHFSTRDLIKALFAPDVDQINVVRPS